MGIEDAQALKVMLDALMRSLDPPMQFAADKADPMLRRMIGSLAGEVIAKIDYEIVPYLHSQYPELKTGE